MGDLSISYNSDIPAFGSRMRAALNGPRPLTDLLLVAESGAISREIINNANSRHYPTLDLSLATAAPSLNPNAFGDLMRANMFNPIGFSDSALNSYELGIEIANLMSLNPRIDVNSEILGSINFNLTPTNNYSVLGISDRILANLSSLNIGGGAGVLGGGINQNTDYAKFEKKVKLLNKIGDYNEEIQEVRTKMKGDYKKGIELLDAIIKNVDKSDLNDAIKEMHEEEQEAKIERAETISDAWANQIANNTDGVLKVSTASLNKDNVLDVLGTFLTNENISKDMWNDLVENNFRDIAKALKEKARAMKKECKDESIKQQIQAAQDKFGKVSADTPNIGQASFEFFSTLRQIEASLLDSGAAKKYGVPEGTTINNPTVATDRYSKETAAYSKIKKLDTAA